MAALRVILQHAETRTQEFWWKTHVVNKWVDQLPETSRCLVLLGQLAILTHWHQRPRSSTLDSRKQKLAGIADRLSELLTESDNPYAEMIAIERKLHEAGLADCRCQ
jgi:hypothetical protein